MNRKQTSHKWSHLSRVWLPLLLVAGMLTPGCAGKRNDFLGSLAKLKSSADEEARAAEEDVVDKDKSSLIAGTESSDSSARLSAFTDEEIIEGPPRLRDRIRKLFRRDDPALIAGDPFLESEGQSAADAGHPDDARPPIVTSDSSKVDELLASFQSPAPADRESIESVKPWWESDHPQARRTEASQPRVTSNRTVPTDAAADFSRGFESRLDSLRAELSLTDQAKAETPPVVKAIPTIADNREMQSVTTVSAAQEAINPFANEASEHPLAVRGQAARETNGVAIVPNGHPTLMTQPRTESSASVAGDHPMPDDARSRVNALMEDAHQEWENWDLPGAHASAAAARELAEKENVAFDSRQQRPGELLEQIEREVQRDAVPTLAGTTDSSSKDADLASLPPLGRRSAAATFGFDELDRLANPWKAKPVAELSGTSEPVVVRETSTTVPASTDQSGVSLLPPDDDFPNEAQRGDWASGLTREEAGTAAEIRLTTHRLPEFTREEDRLVRDEMTGFSDADNQALLRNVAEQKNRVLESSASEWPALPAPIQAGQQKAASEEPIRVARGPRFTLENDVAGTTGEAVTAAAPTRSSSLLGQIWRSQPIWLIGGLVLLVIALRLIPWSRSESP